MAAKLDFQKKTEVKEQLTEHLCTIIQQNELRKAQKLEGLMQQLEVEADEENLELEIEVEQMLQQQNLGAKTQMESQTLAPVGIENSVPQTISNKQGNQSQMVSETLVEQTTYSHTNAQGQKINSEETVVHMTQED